MNEGAVGELAGEQGIWIAIFQFQHEKDILSHD